MTDITKIKTLDICLYSFGCLHLGMVYIAEGFPIFTHTLILKNAKITNDH